MRFLQKTFCSALFFTSIAIHVNAAVIYNEAISGDLSNSGLSPTSLTVALGSNQIFGTTGRGATAIDRDYFSITVPSGLAVTLLSVLPGTTSGGISFIGLQAGPQVTVSTSAIDATGLLGWWHYSPSDINTNILPKMAVPTQGSSGFSGVLGAGTYSFWVQDFNAGSFNYGFDVTVAQAPEPATYAAVLTGISIIAALQYRRRNKRI